MTLLAHPGNVRAIVVETFQQHDTAICREWDVVESALFDEGKCVARSYRFRGLMAMWLIGVGILQFYDGEGNMLGTVDVSSNPESHRLAA